MDHLGRVHELNHDSGGEDEESKLFAKYTGVIVAL